MVLQRDDILKKESSQVYGIFKGEKQNKIATFSLAVTIGGAYFYN